ncbi:MAG: hypothetical protein AABW64_02330 [Nanoarchaeota archaeon]
MGGKGYQVLLGLLLLLVAFFAFGTEESEMTGEAVQKIQPLKTQQVQSPQFLDTKKIDIGKLPAGTKIVHGNRQALARAAQDPILSRLNILRSPRQER